MICRRWRAAARRRREWVQVLARRFDVTRCGAPELGYAERPAYKRKPRKMLAALWRAERARTCDDLVRRLGQISAAAPPLLPSSHRRTQQLATEPSPADDTAYRHREDLIDAVVCAWTAALWSRHGPARCQGLGLPHPPARPSAATIIAPDRPERR